MAKYTKIPIEIEAVQWFKDGDHHAVTSLAEMREGKRKFFISTLEGDMSVVSGCWIITGIKGEHYPVQDEIFRATYKLSE